jgi:branched-chain amino acid transport system ATP-binding protein
MTAALAIRELRKSFGATAIIRGITLEIMPGERHALIGPNGAGKSTFFHLVSGRYAPDSGQVLLHGEDITGLPPHLINRRGLSRSFQVTSLFTRMTVFENLRNAAMRSAGVGHAFWRAVTGYAGLNSRAEEMLELTGLAPRRDVLAGALAYADQRALEIGVAVAGGASTVLLDEPTAGMSHAETERASVLIRRVTQGKTLVMIEHDLGVVFDLADRITVLADGQVIASGAPSDVRGNPALRQRGVRRDGYHRPPAARDCPLRLGLRAGRPCDLPRLDHAAESVAGGKIQGSSGPGGALHPGGRLRPVPKAGRAGERSRRRAVGRRTADAGDLPHDDGLPGFADGGRTD